MKLALTNLLSYCAGKMFDCPLPAPLLNTAISVYSRMYGVNSDEIQKPAQPFRSLGEFFVRDLKPGARPLGEGIVSPVDGLLRDFGPVVGGEIEQIKGRHYSVEELLGGQRAESFKRGYFFNFYLAPGDYHHIHAPCDGTIVGSAYIPGALWPVNDLSLRFVDKLFVRNERAVTFIQSRWGLIAVVMVGATNVGKMRLAYDSYLADLYPSFLKCSGGNPVAKSFEPGRSCTKGDRLGTFCMGSSVVLLMEEEGAAKLGTIRVERCSKIVYGKTLCAAAE